MVGTWYPPCRAITTQCYLVSCLILSGLVHSQMLAPASLSFSTTVSNVCPFSLFATCCYMNGLTFEFALQLHVASSLSYFLEHTVTCNSLIVPMASPVTALTRLRNHLFYALLFIVLSHEMPRAEMRLNVPRARVSVRPG